MSSSRFFYSFVSCNLVFLNLFVFLGTSMGLNFTESNGEDLIYTICNHTRYYEVCVSSLRSDPRSETADLQGLANIALNLSRVYGEATLAYIIDLKSKATGNDTLSSCLGDCIEEYQDANENLQEAVEALRVRLSDDLKTFVSSAMTDSDTCEQGFKEMQPGSQGSPLADKNQYFSKLCSNFLAVASLLS